MKKKKNSAAFRHTGTLLRDSIIVSEVQRRNGIANEGLPRHLHKTTNKAKIKKHIRRYQGLDI